MFPIPKKYAWYLPPLNSNQALGWLYVSYAPLTPGKEPSQKYWFSGELWPNMDYFSNSRWNWAGAFWDATAIPLVLDPSNPIWDESGWWAEQFGAPFASIGPSGGNDYFTSNFWAGRGSETVGRRGPGTSPNVSPIIRGTCGAQMSKMYLRNSNTVMVKVSLLLIPELVRRLATVQCH